MKKYLLLIFIIFSLATITAIFYFGVNRETDKKIPKRSANIPSTAVWVGGVDGGNWYQVTKIIAKDKFKIRIFDGNGDLNIDTIFTLNQDCFFKNIDSITLIRNIDGFDGKNIILLMPEQGKKCFLLVDK